MNKIIPLFPLFEILILEILLLLYLTHRHKLRCICTLSTCDVTEQKIMESSLRLCAICFILQNISLFPASVTTVFRNHSLGIFNS